MTTLENGSDLTGQVVGDWRQPPARHWRRHLPRAAAHGAAIAFSHWRPYDAAFPWSGTPTEPDDLAQELTTLGVRTAAIECTSAIQERRCVAGRNRGASRSDQHPGQQCRVFDQRRLRAARRGDDRRALRGQHARRDAPGGGVRPPLRRGRRGRIINITSGQGLGPMPDELATVRRRELSRRSRAVSPPRSRQGDNVNAVNRPTDSGWITAAARRSLTAVPNGTARRLPMPRVWWRGWRARTRAG